MITKRSDHLCNESGHASKHCFSSPLSIFGGESLFRKFLRRSTLRAVMNLPEASAQNGVRGDTHRQCNVPHVFLEVRATHGTRKYLGREMQHGAPGRAGIRAIIDLRERV